MPNMTMLDIDDLLQSELAGFVKKCLKHRAAGGAHTEQSEIMVVAGAGEAEEGGVGSGRTGDHLHPEDVAVEADRPFQVGGVPPRGGNPGVTRSDFCHVRRGPPVCLGWSPPWVFG